MDLRYDVVIAGAGAAGMMCAAQAAQRGRKVLVIDHAKAPGEKIRISGGGRCNFTNINTTPNNFLSENPRFCISALRRYRPKDFIALVDSYGVAHHEKTLGQLFCDGSARQIIDLLLAEMAKGDAELALQTSIQAISHNDTGFTLQTSAGEVACARLVIATGGKSIPKMGASGFGYDVARQFGLRVTDTRPALVPLTFDVSLLERTAPLAGVAVDATVSAGKTRFSEALLFTHRGLSGPSILQASSYWREGQEIAVDLAPGQDVYAHLRAARTSRAKAAPATILAELLPKRLAQYLAETHAPKGNMADQSDKVLRPLAEAVNAWRVKPVGSEGYRTAEVTLGGVDTNELESRTLEARKVPGLYFIGEVVDVTGWLGGYNFQWAWASGWSAGQSV